MELKNVFTFMRVADLGSFTKAAEEMGYTQSTVTIQIQQLERELGVPLFDRIGRKITLTPMGREFLNYANEISSLVIKARSLVNAPANHRGTVRVGILESLFVWRFCDLIPTFHALMPKVDMKIVLLSGFELLQKMKQNEIDVAYLINRRLLTDDCVHTCANHERIAFVTHASDPLAVRREVPIDEVFRRPILLVERDAVYKTALNELAAERGAEYTPLMECNNIVGLLKLVRAGMGVSFLPEFLLKDGIEAGELAVLDVAGCEVSLWSQVVYHKNKWVTPQMELFMKLIEENISQFR